MSSLPQDVAIRPHHLLCMLGFRGLGYSAEFAANMRRVVEDLRLDRDLRLTIAVGCDVICAACPHCREARCSRAVDSAAKSATLDLKVLAKLALEPGARISFGDALRRIEQRVTADDMREFCSDCEWWGLGYCLAGLKELKSHPLHWD
jgi:uncharacterized protein